MEARRSDLAMIAETGHPTAVTDDPKGAIEQSGDRPEFVSNSPELVSEPPRLLRSHRRRLLPPWFQRHWWVLVLCLVAGTGGGVVASGSQKVMYSASAELIVASGASVAGPGPANDANALALTDASIVPYGRLNLAAGGERDPYPTERGSQKHFGFSGDRDIGDLRELQGVYPSAGD